MKSSPEIILRTFSASSNRLSTFSIQLPLLLPPFSSVDVLKSWWPFIKCLKVWRPYRYNSKIISYTLKTFDISFFEEYPKKIFCKTMDLLSTFWHQYLFPNRIVSKYWYQKSINKSKKAGKPRLVGSSKKYNFQKYALIWSFKRNIS